MPPRNVEESEELDTKWTGMEWQGEWSESAWEWEPELSRSTPDYIR